MAKRFIVSTSSLGKDFDFDMATFFNEINIKWWHWLPNFWLLVSSDDRVVAKDIRAKAQEFKKGIEIFVLEISGETDWSVSLIDQSEKKAGWLRTEWDKHG